MYLSSCYLLLGEETLLSGLSLDERKSLIEKIDTELLYCRYTVCTIGSKSVLIIYADACQIFSFYEDNHSIYFQLIDTAEPGTRYHDIRPDGKYEKIISINLASFFENDKILILEDLFGHFKSQDTVHKGIPLTKKNLEFSWVDREGFVGIAGRFF